MFWKNDWLQYSYDGVNNLKIKNTPSSVWNLSIKKTIDRPIKSYQEELILNAQAVREHFSEPFDLMLSGGVDSEVVLRSFILAKIPINVFTFKFKEDINKHDLLEAFKTCDIYGVKPKVIEFDLKKFLEQDAETMWSKAHFAGAGYMINMKLIEHLDNIPIIGDGINADNFDIQKNNCDIVIYEKHFAGAVYGNAIGRPIISSWYDFSPELTASFLDLRLHKWKKHKLMGPPFTNDKLHELKYINFNKLLGTRIRDKFFGWEMSLTKRVPHKYVQDFNSNFVKNRVTLKNYTQNYDVFRSLL